MSHFALATLKMRNNLQLVGPTLKQTSTKSDRDSSTQDKLYIYIVNSAAKMLNMQFAMQLRLKCNNSTNLKHFCNNTGSAIKRCTLNMFLALGFRMRYHPQPLQMSAPGSGRFSLRTFVLITATIQNTADFDKKEQPFLKIVL